MTRVKICGNRTPADVIAAAEAGADFVGIIFAESPRHVTAEDATMMVQALGGPASVADPHEFAPGVRDDIGRWFEHGAHLLQEQLDGTRPLTVGVFADQPIDEVNALADAAGVDLVQLSGDESWEDCLAVTRPVIQVVHVSPIDSPSDPMQFVEPGFARALMLDSAHGPYRGGSGRAFNWDVAHEVASHMPLWLAGGLTPENVGDAIDRARPWLVDVGSGTETDGRKDHALVRAFIDAVRETDSASDTAIETTPETAEAGQ
jgi:phosphoribosylanthranilate isomerase